MNRPSVGNIHSPRNERKRLPSLDGSVDSMNVKHYKENIHDKNKPSFFSVCVQMKLHNNNNNNNSNIDGRLQQVKRTFYY